jgi:hypothetical protein
MRGSHKHAFATTLARCDRHLLRQMQAWAARTTHEDRRARWRTAHRDAQRADDQTIAASRRTPARAWPSLHSSASRVRVKTRGGMAHATMQSVRAEVGGGKSTARACTVALEGRARAR